MQSTETRLLLPSCHPGPKISSHCEAIHRAIRVGLHQGQGEVPRGELRAGSQAQGKAQSWSPPGPARHQGSRSESMSQRHPHSEPCPPPESGPPGLACLQVPHVQRDPQPQDTTWVRLHRKRGRRIRAEMSLRDSFPQRDLDFLLAPDVSFVQHAASAGWLRDRDTGRGRG